MCQQLTISGIERCPCEKTIALGGVATGIMKAKDVARAEEAIRYIGLTLILIAWRITPVHFNNNRNPDRLENNTSTL